MAESGVYDDLQQKRITAWMDLRNKAAHGSYADYDKSRVRLFIDGVRAFILQWQPTNHTKGSPGPEGERREG
ncbi:hypothetical protein OOK58_33020 [Streptomyces sp. NBC_01728]|nr:hypothetical protein [Streptomyces sp. NBC_01728]MCX4456791.1 hypothetical protein [Streptomyces sp. NBC_01719]MCX4496150.1 hypothetical protein [Streptomyces sp. NBC_01728]